MDQFSLRRIKQAFVSEVYLDRMLATRVPTVEVAMGGLIWLMLVVGFVRTLDTALWLLASLVTVPLLLRQSRRATSGPSTAMLAWLGVFSVPVAAFAALGFVGPSGLGFLASLPWLGLTVLISCAGLFRLFSRPSMADPMVAMDIGLIMVGVSGAAFSLSRFSSNPEGGLGRHALLFILPAIAGEVARRRDQRWWVGVLPAVFLVVAAILSGRTGVVGLVAGTLFLLAAAVVSAGLIRLGSQRSPLPQFLLMVGGVALGLGAGVHLATRVMVFLNFDGDAADLFSRFDGPLLAAGVALPAIVGLHLLAPEPGSQHGKVMMHLGAPTPEQLSRLLEEAEYTKPRAELNPFADEPPVGYRLHRASRGVPDFENSCEALWTWAGHDAAKISMVPVDPPILIGSTFLLTVPVGPFTITTASQVVALISDEDHYGFVHASLDHNPIVAVESILLDKSSGTSTLTISTVWRPASVLPRLLGPFGNPLLGRFVGKYLDGIAEAETATIGSRMMDMLSDLNKQHYTVSRESIRAESSTSVLATLGDTEVVTQPLSEFEALFSSGFDAPDGTETELD